MSERVLLDTDVFSYMMGNRPDAEPFRPLLQHKVICLSFISIGELYAGAYKKQWGEARFNILHSTINRTLRIPYNDQMPECYGKILAACGRQGRPIAINDAWIAATALIHGIPLISNNVNHFKHVPGLMLSHPSCG